MPPIETRDLPQRAVLWEADGVDSYGQPKVSDVPVEVRVNWNWNVRQSSAPTTDEKSIDATACTDREVSPGSVLLLGTLADLSGTSWTEEDRRKLMEVVSYSEVLDLKGRFTSYDLGLRRYKGALPERVTVNG